MASKNNNTLALVAVPVALLALVLVAIAFAPGPFSKLEPLPAADYVESPANFLGNRYVLRAQIDSQIAWEPELGRLMAVKVEEGGVRIPVFLPAGTLSENPRIGQRYKMRVRIEEGGLVTAEDLKKF